MSRRYTQINADEDQKNTEDTKLMESKRIESGF